MKRRTFLKIAGLGSLTFAAGCTPDTENNLFTLVQAPDDMVTGMATWYAATCRECPAGCGILAKNREGRVIKLEGNPLHPINRGKLCMRGQAALQGIYNPDRLTAPMLREKGQWRTIPFSEAEVIIAKKAETAAGKGADRVRMVTEMVGDSLLSLFTDSLKRWNSESLLVFEPYAYESLRAANREIFGIDGLPSYRMEQADVLVGLGADFLETWLSPVEYARRFKQMHRFSDGGKGLFIHIGPCQSLTATNADQWLPCRPGGEAAIAMAMVRAAFETGRGQGLPGHLAASAKAASAAYTIDMAARATGIDPADLDRLQARLMAAERPLILGTGSGAAGPNAAQADMAANLLNLILDPDLSRIDFDRRHRVEIANPRAEARQFFNDLNQTTADLLLLHNVNPAYAMASGSGVREALKRDDLFVVNFSSFMDETTALADLVYPVGMPLEGWDEYAGHTGIASFIQPAMGSFTQAPPMGDVLLRAAFGADRPAQDYKAWLVGFLRDRGRVKTVNDWAVALRNGGFFDDPPKGVSPAVRLPGTIDALFEGMTEPLQRSGEELSVVATPSIRFFDGRGANRPWLAEIPDPLTKVAWQTPVLVHPQTLAERSIEHQDLVEVETAAGKLVAPVYESEGVLPGIVQVSIGQGHTAFGRYAQNVGGDPLRLLPPDTDPLSGAPLFAVAPATLAATGEDIRLAHTDGSRIQHGRKIALSVPLEDAGKHPAPKKGLAMWEFPLTLPTPEGYDAKRDLYPPHEHNGYRWAMVVDLDKCIGCGACSAACYAENNIGVVGVERIIEGREMAWIRVERYLDPQRPDRVIFLPMMCQHCDNAPCEPVCPVYAPHHGSEGLNNQIYNRCIGTRFCGQNCPYKVRRFNWFDWQWPEPLPLQLNPNVTVRSKGVMEKCSFCVQRIKHAHGVAKNEKRRIRDGEIQTACMQTCPTGAITFGDIQDKKSKVRQMTTDPRAYQVMGYINTKPAVIYLRKVLQEL